VAKQGAEVKALNWLRDDTFPVWVKPQARRNHLVGLREGALHVQLTSPPVEGKANEALAEFLADLVGVRRRQVEIVSGERSRHKVVRISEIDPEELRRRIEQALQSV